MATVSAGIGPQGVGYDSGNGYVYVANCLSDNVSVIDGTAVVATIPVGKTPYSVGYDSGNGYVYVANMFSDNVSVINGTTVVTAIAVGSSPRGVGYDDANGYVYVANGDADTVSSNDVDVINGTTVVATVSVGSGPADVGYDGDNGYVYIANIWSDTVSVINGTTVVATIPVGSGRLGSAFATDRKYHLEFLGDLQPIPTFCDATALPTVVELGDRMAQSGYQVLFSGFLNANAARGNGERIVAFVGFWLLVEMVIAEELTRYLTARNTQPTIIEASLRSWTLYERIALVKKWNVSQPLAPGDPTMFSRAELSEIRKLAKVRNKIMHAGQRPSDHDVERASTLGSRAM